MSARSVYARKKIQAKKNVKGRGRLISNRKSKTTSEKRIDRRGRPTKIAKVEEHSSEADNSSEGEDEDNENLENNVSSDDKSVAYDTDSANVKEENRSEEEVSENDEDSQDAIDGVSMASSDDEEVRYSFAKPIKTSSPKPNSSNKYSTPKEGNSKRKSHSFEEFHRNSNRPKKIKKEIKQERISISDHDSSAEREQSRIFNTGSQTLPSNSASSQTYDFLAASSQTHSNSRVKTEQHPDNATHSERKYGTSMASVVSLNKASICGNIAADEAFRWLISPLSESRFFDDIFEKEPCHELRNKPSYYRELFSGCEINDILKQNNLEYKVHIDVLKYINHKRVPLEADGRAYCSNVWEDYAQGYSVRIRNPQSYHKKLWNFCSLLQEYFSSTVGVNVYLTPPNAQGFPPHYDDIDAIIAQVEGTKHWKIYHPRFPHEELDRKPSVDFSPSDLDQPMLEVTLSAGDLLYIPRGYIHQAVTSTEHSLHLTFSVNQLNTWGDLLMTAMGNAVERAIENEVALRKSVPRNFMDCAGVSIDEMFDGKRDSFANTMMTLAKNSLKYLDVDEAVDHHAVRFLRSSLPIAFNKVEKQRSIHGNMSHYVDGGVRLRSGLSLNTEVQLIRKRSVRLIVDEKGPRVYHNLENSKDSLAEGESVYCDLKEDEISPFAFLMSAHPQFVRIEDLPMENDQQKVCFATSLYENGLLMTKEPLPMLTQTD